MQVRDIEERFERLERRQDAQAMGASVDRTRIHNLEHPPVSTDVASLLCVGGPMDGEVHALRPSTDRMLFPAYSPISTRDPGRPVYEDRTTAHEYRITTLFAGSAAISVLAYFGEK